ncbi:hypothetical protein M407DRAFT_244002, partial [Tulasnella calospora MUT 4182]
HPTTDRRDITGILEASSAQRLPAPLSNQETSLPEPRTGRYPPKSVRYGGGGSRTLYALLPPDPSNSCTPVVELRWNANSSLE